MDLGNGLNLIGLLLITFGSLTAAGASPAPQYGKDGSISMAGEVDKAKRIGIYKRQKRFSRSLFAIAVGAFLQALTLLINQG